MYLLASTLTLWRDLFLPAAILFVLAVLLGSLIYLISHFTHREGDEKKELLLEALPGANCGACGFIGCEGYAAYLANGGQDTARCPVGGHECAMKLADILGVEVKIRQPEVACVLCQGTTDHTDHRYAYRGTLTCRAAHSLLGGPNACIYGCLGYGDCVDVCNYNAISIQSGIARVQPSACTGCRMCVNICPKNIITMVPKAATVAVKCVNPQPGRQTRLVCDIGCIGCRKCQIVCPVGAITMKDHRAVIDQDICNGCQECVRACPTRSISILS